MFKALLKRFMSAAYPVQGPGLHYGVGGSFRWSTTGDYDYVQQSGDRYDNSTVLACIRWLAANMAQASIVLERSRSDGTGWREIKNHPLVQLLRAPNRYYSAAAIWEATILSDAVDGNGYWLVNRKNNGLPGELNYVPHWAMIPISDDPFKLIKYYQYRVSGGPPIDIPYEDVVHFRRGIDPRNPRKGLSRVGAVLREICTENEASTFSAALLRNMGVPGVILSPKGDVVSEPTNEQKKTLRERWSSFTADMRGEPFVAPYPVDVQSPGFSPQQMVIDKVRAIPSGRICSAFNIDPLVIHLPSDTKTYSNFEEAERQALLHAFLPMIAEFASTLEVQLFPVYGLEVGTYRLRFDTSTLHALQDNVSDMQDRWRANWLAGGVTRSEYRDFLMLPTSKADDLYYTDLTMGGPVEDSTDDQAADDAKTKSSISARLARANKILARLSDD